MYSQCPNCQAIFSVSDADIAAHHGLVRCGHCSAIFHALKNEVGDAALRAGAPVRPDTDQPGGGGSPGTESPVTSEPSRPGQPEPDRAELEESEPEVSEPEVSEPEVSEPEVSEPEVSEPEVSEPEVPEPEVPEPEVPEPEVPEPEVSEPEVSEPEVAAPEAHEPGAPAETRDEQRTAEGGPDLPGEIVEEITIEAPPLLWNVFDEEAEDATQTEARREAPARPPRAGHAPPPADPGTEPAGGAPGARKPLRAPRRGSDVTMVELPQPRPFKTATLSLLTVLLALLLVWQAKTFYLDELAQVPVLRPYLESLCRPLGCVVPPRSDFAQVDLVGTSIDVNPQVPGALAITASLINRAHFPQPYPPLRVTLTDREGRVVGRRTYLPSEYLAQDAGDLLPIREPRDVTINLAQPAENAVGYEIELMAPASGGE